MVSRVAYAATLSKPTSQSLLNWFTFISGFSYAIYHIPDAENNMGDWLSRLRAFGSRVLNSGEKMPECVRTNATVIPVDADYSVPSMSKIRDS